MTTKTDDIILHRLKILKEAEASGNISATCNKYGIDRKKYYELKKRYELEGENGLKKQSRAHHTHPDKLPEIIIQKILNYSKLNPEDGASKIKKNLKVILTTEELQEYSISKTTIQNYLNKFKLNSKDLRTKAFLKKINKNEEKFISDFIKVIKMINPDFKHLSYNKIKHNTLNYFSKNHIKLPIYNLDILISELTLFSKGDVSRHIEERLWQKVYQDFNKYINKSEPELWKLFNEIIDIPDLFNSIKKRDDFTFDEDFTKLLKKTEKYRQVKNITLLSTSQKFNIRLLNRLIIQSIYNNYLNTYS